MISVVMPVRNCEAYIEESIQSILDQSYSDFEFIIIDDGSTDRTIEIIESMDDNRIKFRPMPHIGFVRQLNYAIFLSEGKYIARQDGDDYSHPERFKRQVDFLNENEECQVVGTAMILTDDAPTNTLIHRERVTHKNLLNNWPCIGHPTTMWRSIHVDDFLIDTRVGPYDETMEYCEDYDLWLRVAEQYGDDAIRNLTDLLYTKREHPLTRTKEGLDNCLLKLYDEMARLKSKIRLQGGEP